MSRGVAESKTGVDTRAGGDESWNRDAAESGVAHWGKLEFPPEGGPWNQWNQWKKWIEATEFT